MHTRKFPRTLEEAFGPYQRKSQIVPMPDTRTPRAEWALYAVAVLALVVLVWRLAA